MKNFNAIAVASLTLLLGTSARAAAPAAPTTMPLQGVLTDATGKPITAATNVEFSIWDAASSGNSLWTEAQSVTPDNGVFTAYLGSQGTPLHLSDFRDHADLWLQIKVGADAAMPRVKLSTVPYGAFAQYCGDVTGTVPQASLPSGTLVGPKTCPGTDKVTGISEQGALTCGTDLTAGGGGITGTGTAGQVPMFTGASAVAASTIFQDNQGRIGIGTTTPGPILTIQGAFGATGSGLGVINTTGQSRIDVGPEVTSPTGTRYGTFMYDLSNSRATLTAATGATNGLVLGAGAGPVAFTTGAPPIERMRIDAAGKVGIGTTTPGVIPGWSQPAAVKVLEVSGDGSASPNSEGILALTNNKSTAVSNDELGAMIFASKNDTGGHVAGISSNLRGGGGANGFGGSLTFMTKADNVAGDKARMTIDQNGNVGIGTATPATSLDVAGNSTVGSTGNVTARFRACNGGACDAGVVVGTLNGVLPFVGALSGNTSAQALAFLTDGTERMRIRTSDGFVGIGTPNPAAALDVQTATPGLKVGATCVSGTCPSDRDLKQNIRYLSGSLATITRLKPAEYRFKDDPRKQVGYGLIAQDVEKVAPQLVDRSDDGKLRVNYSPLEMMLIESTKALKAENDALRAQSATLEARLARIEAQLSKH